MSNAQSPGAEPSNDPSHPSPADVLAIFAEPLVRGRRVAVVGVVEERLVDTVLELGARLVHVYDPRPNVVESRGRAGVTILPLRHGDLTVRDGAFDLAIVPDLALLGDLEAAIAHVRRLVGVSGAAVVAVRNREVARGWLAAPEAPNAPSYNEFFDLCALQFSDVRMLGAAPFAGYAVAEFAPSREPAIAFDGSLVPIAEPPEWFVAVVAQHPPAGLEAFEIVQVPARAVAPSDVGGVGTRSQLVAVEQKLREAEARAGDQYVRAERLTGELRTVADELHKYRDRATRVQKELEDERRTRTRTEEDLHTARRAPDLRERVASLEAELIEARTALATPRASSEVDARLQIERDRFATELVATREKCVHQERALIAAEQGLAQMNSAVEELSHRLVERERALEATLRRAKELEDRLAEHLAQASTVESRERELSDHARRADAIALAARDELATMETTHRDDVASLEVALRTAGEELRHARLEIHRRDRLVRELVSEVELAQQGAPARAVEPPQRMDAGALEQLDVARRELTVLVEEVRRRDVALAEAELAQKLLAERAEKERARNDDLAREAARREAALQTASWRITELEKLGTDAPVATAPDGDRVRLEAELDALRRALLQEHAEVERLRRVAEEGR